MTRLTKDDYLAHLRADAARLREVLAGVDPAASVPSCPGWTAADLVWHVGGEVQDFWGWVIEHRPEPPRSYEEPARPTSYDDLLALYDETSARFLATLEAADPAETAWSWASERSVAFTFRRQAHELLIHRVDAEQTAGVASEVDPRLAADGVDEILDIFYGGKPDWASFSPLPHYVRIDAIDTDTQVWVQLGLVSGTTPSGAVLAGDPDINVVPDPGVEPDAVVEGLAADLDLWLWNRRDDEGIAVTGDRDLYEQFRELTSGPINND